MLIVLWYVLVHRVGQRKKKNICIYVYICVCVYFIIKLYRFDGMSL